MKRSDIFEILVTWRRLFFLIIFEIFIFFAFFSPIIPRENSRKSTSLFLFSFRGDLYFSTRVDFFEKRVEKIKRVIFLKYWWFGDGCFFNYFRLTRDLYILCIFFSDNSKSTSLFLFSSRGDLYFSVRVDFLKEVEKNVKMMFILKRKKNRYICVSSVKEIIWLEIIYLH